jgi:hypothetical protein
MRDPSSLLRRMPLLSFGLLAFLAVALMAGAQSQEPKPKFPGTSVPETAAPVGSTPVTGVSDSSWRGPNFGLRLDWDPAVWTVEGELIDRGYDGLQLGTPRSTVFVEAYEDFAGDADACLAEAEREIRARESATEVSVLEGRELPDLGEVRGPMRLFGLVAKNADGMPYRALEFVACRTIVPGSAVLELTWQTAPASYNQEKPLVEALLSTVALSSLATPVAWPSVPAASTLQEPGIATMTPSP